VRGVDAYHHWEWRYASSDTHHLSLSSWPGVSVRRHGYVGHDVHHECTPLLCKGRMTRIGLGILSLNVKMRREAFHGYRYPASDRLFCLSPWKKPLDHGGLSVLWMVTPVYFESKGHGEIGLFALSKVTLVHCELRTLSQVIHVGLVLPSMKIPCRYFRCWDFAQATPERQLFPF